MTEPSKKKTAKKAVKAAKSCTCFEDFKSAAKEKGFEFETVLMLGGGKAEFKGPLLAAKWIGKKPRGRSGSPSVFCTYCPFCGKKS